jgi:pimeloyl-ACP methyl ester carboxylesterase
MPGHRPRDGRHRRRVSIAQAFLSGLLPPIQVAQTRVGRMSYVVSGEGEPSLVLFNGAGVSLEGWRALYPAIEDFGTVFAWNRLGVKGSDAPTTPQSGNAVIASLRELLGYAGLQPPYVLVGHSLGGLYANLFARLYPSETLAVMFVEATHPRDQEVLKQHETLFAQGIAKVLELPQRMFSRNLHAEIEWVGETVRQVEAAGDFPPVPVTVVTGGKAPPVWLLSPAAAGARRAHQQDLARLSPHGEQVIAQGSGHFPQLTEPQLVLEALEALLRRVG